MIKPIKALFLITLAGWLQGTVLAQHWTPTSAPDLFWRGMASSADGSELVAAEGGNEMGPICTSTNSGATWVTNNAPYLYWTAIASSADGKKLVAEAYGSGIYISTNSGGNWISNSVPQTNWQGVASSADGTILAAVVNGGGIYISTNSGGAWKPSLAPVENWNAIASSADGTTMAATINGGGIYLSTDSGSTWNPSANTPETPTPWMNIASSAKGDKLAATTLSAIYISTNSGNSWIPTTNGAISVAMSADGTKLVAADSEDGIYTSTNSGFNWTQNDAPTGGNWNWQYVTISADGGKLAAAWNQLLASGGIWTSQTIQPPKLNIGIAGSSAMVSWIIPSTNFVLQQTYDLAIPDWTTMTNIATFDYTTLQDEAPVPLSGSRNFYRLQTP